LECETLLLFVLGAVCCRAENDGASVGESGESTLGDAALQLTKRPATQAVRRSVRGGCKSLRSQNN
jgi:hypothetical protein